MADVQIDRQPKQSLRLAFNGIVGGGCGAWLIYDAWPAREVFWIALGVLFALWSLLLFVNLFTRKTYLHADDQGVTVFGILKSRRALYGDMTWATIDPDTRASVIAHRPVQAAKDRFIALSNAAVGQDGIAALADVIGQHRPDLPKQRPQS